MKKVFYIISDIDKALAFEWIALNLNQKEIELTFVLLNKKNTELERFLSLHNKSFKRIYLHSRFGLLITWLNLFLYLLKKRPDIIHTHMRYATILGISAGFIAGIKTRINTRHYSTQNHLYYPHAVKTDRFINRLAIKIVAPSKTVLHALTKLENVDSNKIALIHHGFDLKTFENPNSTSVAALKSKLQIDDKSPVVGVIARYLELKGIQFIIPAFAKFLEKEPNAMLVIANASGKFAPEIKNLLNGLPIESYREINFENDLSSLYACFNYFVHVPIDADVEAFGQVYVEALAAGVPSIFTLSGIANEFIEHDQNALVVPHQNSDAILQALLLLRNNLELSQKLSYNGRESVKRFNLETFIKKTEALYE
jgi:glycosyltransferase involved in cell wall biosynthesis